MKHHTFACPKAKTCGGCQLQNMSYAEQLAYKQRKCRRYLSRYGKIRPIVGMEDPTHYRHKVQAAFQNTRGGRVISGVYQSSSHRLVPVDDCLIEDRLADEIIVFIRSLLPGFKLRAYDEDAGRGFLRHVLVRRAFATGQTLVALVTGTPVFPHKKHFVQALVQRFPQITTVVWNINDRRTSLVLGEREEVLYGDGHIVDEVCGMRFLLSARSFYQINPVQTAVLYSAAIRLAGLRPDDRVLDAYCGVGTIGLLAAGHCGSVTGVELNPAAVADAGRNAALNAVTNARFLCADAGDFMRRAAGAGERFDVVFCDPPRAGCSRAFLDALLTLAPARVVYISCNPETQARDLALLTRDYRVQTIQPVDMFPYTNHVETVVLMSRVKD